MKKYIVYVLLGILAVGSALLEGYLELPANVIQANGALTILWAVALVAWALNPGRGETRKE